MSNELGLRAVSFHTEYQGVTMDSPWVMRYLDRMGELGMVPLLHAADVSLHEALWRLGKVARALPDLTIVAIEPFFTHHGMDHCSFIADVAPNVTSRPRHVSTPTWCSASSPDSVLSASSSVASTTRGSCRRARHRRISAAAEPGNSAAITIVGVESSHD